jgi:cysteine desulfurase
MKEEVYLDFNASTPCDHRVITAMLPYFAENAGNPSSTHRAGERAFQAVEGARRSLADLIEAEAEDIIFTSGATESISLAIRGFLERHQGITHRRRIITSEVEHKAVLETFAQVEKMGYEIIMAPVDSDGAVNVEKTEALIDDSMVLASFQSSNNETGTIQPISKLAEICHSHGVVVHSDATQSVGKLPVSVRHLGVDLMSFSSHKMYGPKGVGALYVRGGARIAVLSPLLVGGGQEVGLRGGTQNTPAIVGFGEACRISKSEQLAESKQIKMLRDSLEQRLKGLFPALLVCAEKSNRLPNTSSVIFRGVQADLLLINAPSLCISLGSACNSGAIGPSHVLRAMGLTDSEAYSTIRFSLGRFTTDRDLDLTVGAIRDALTVIANAN